MREKFNSHIRKTDNCWEWSWLKDKDGYGLFPYAGKQYRAHVLALEFDGRPVTRGQYGCHHCDNPSCVRPDHLYPGSPKQNMADAVARKRLRPRAKLSEEDIIKIRDMEGTHGQIASKFGVTRATISLILERKTWGHVR